MNTRATIAGRFQTRHRIGTGTFGDVFVAWDNDLERNVAVKVENPQIPTPTLHNEYKVLKNIAAEAQQAERGSDTSTQASSGVSDHNTKDSTTPNNAAAVAATPHSGCLAPVGFPEVYIMTKFNESDVMAMELLGPSLEDLLSYCLRRFTATTVGRLGLQMLDRLERLHTCGYVHRDIKPENFLLGLGTRSSIVYLVDYGLCKRYRDDRGNHLPPRQGTTLTGTVRYCSLSAHDCFEHGRKDDLEALAYVLVYFSNGGLPWQGLKHVSNVLEKSKKVAEIKAELSPSKLCEGLPSQLGTFLKTVRELSYEATPDYKYLRGLLFQMVQEQANLLRQVRRQERNEFTEIIMEPTNPAEKRKISSAPNSNSSSQQPVLLEAVAKWPPFDWVAKRKEELGIAFSPITPAAGLGNQRVSLSQ